MTNAQIMERDLAHIWHPCTQMKDHESIPLIPIKKAKGVYLYDFDGNRYIDGISSWWVNLFGHQNPYINEKIQEQLAVLEHVIFAGFTHEQIVRLSERLVTITPNGLNKCFYADNGSSAIEVALKMSFHYFKNRGETRPYFVSLTNSYHGETLGALAVGDVELYKETYEEIMIRTLQAKVPKDRSEKATDEAIKDLQRIFETHKGEISAFIVEPLVQCAGYMHMYAPEYLTKAKRLCEAYDIHFIADEIAVGFGRTGTMFACEQAGISPDFMCLSKGLTGGYLPLSVVLTTDDVYNAFYCDYNEFKAFLHSHSYTGNALACAAANATLDIFEREDVIEKNRVKIEYIKQKLQTFSELPCVKEVRQTGMIAAVELQGFDPKERIGLHINQTCLKKGIFIRPLGSVVYFMPPYIIDFEEIDTMIEGVYETIKELCGRTS
ncbi:MULTISPECIES: adenosylmethionine--8-amino-7-oxononanoate transaminase [unclassified Nitratiruptor]|uniref:adenosylmethionine--8-amino-7-oxononanoate transaminase n=1 Tax=unclassified Nitratiruptor TaxID=2624044 RepID=UPI0019153466|nr:MULTISPECIES: adenosylmethionine--8-amino-7-oxononanoate transaminase [unclassified Nitratiruptor]BCD60254.1 adenosylmethionine---8-amino-7-oxononanoate aminotransferase [Nitratiruptor sp. YY08-10]BCD64257.1 adenosylmethionine---8-amino-7-oxononanoate aminotransferase [Nitratiruptor sp. YY08-14]